MDMFDFLDSDRLHNFDYRMMERAVQEAYGSEFHHFKTGCVITYKRHIVSTAHNVERTTPAQKKYNKLRNFNNNDNREPEHKTHAEILAIQRISYTAMLQTEWSRASIYVARIAPGLPKGVGLARPCPACMEAIRDLGIKNIFYTSNEGSIIYERR